MERIAVVTGANRGIGRQTAEDLAALGFHDLLTARDEARGREATSAMQEKGLPVAFHQLDVTDAASIRRLVKNVADVYGRADVLINNAAVNLDKGVSPLELDLATLRQTIE